MEITVFMLAYNSAKYIDDCIQSVLNQTMRDFEYIIVDNGSTDETLQIIHRYADKDKRIQVKHIEVNTKGFWIGMAAEVSKGKYFTKVDDDDILEPNYLEELYRYAEKEHLDMAICGAYYFINNHQQKKVLRSPETTVMSVNQFYQNLCYTHQFARTTWGRLFSTKLLNLAKLDTYHEVIRQDGYGGDTAFTMEIINKCERIGFISKTLYNYRVRRKSCSSEYSKQRICSLDALHKQVMSILINREIKDISNVIFCYKVYLGDIIGLLDLIDGNNQPTITVLDEIKECLSNVNIKQAFEFRRIEPRFDTSLVKTLSKIGQRIQDISELNKFRETILAINPNFDIYLPCGNWAICNVVEDFVFAGFYAKHEQMLRNALDFFAKGEKYDILWNGIKSQLCVVPVLSNHVKKGFVRGHISLVSSIYFGRVSDAYQLLFENELQKEENCEYEELLFLALDFSALLNKPNDFFYAKKLLADYYLANRRLDEAKKALADLNDMNSTDEDVVMLNNIWLQLNQ